MKKELEMKYFEFTPDEKAEMFDVIANHYFEQNFGHMSKTDMDLLMFHFYIEKMISVCTNADGVLDYNKCSDYKISKELGITQQRVRNLKVKNQLVYPSEMERDWKKEFASLTRNARYDQNTKKVIVNIPDPNLYLEIQNFIEEKGAFVEKQLNSKILQIRAEYYIDLVISFETDANRKDIIDKLKKQLSAEGKDDFVFDERNIGKSLIEGAVNITTLAANLSTLITPQNQVGVALMNLLTKKHI